MYGVRADLICVGKGVTSSLPLAAVLGPADVLDVLPPAEIATTHAGHPLSCVAALANLRILEEAIPHETTEQIDLLHKDGTVSMGRLKPGTASFVFFICVNDQPELDYGGNRYADGLGFAAFGQVIEGMDVVRKIQGGETDYQTLKQKINILQIREF